MEIQDKTEIFKINGLLSVKLEGAETVIYVDGEKFRHCKYLFLQIPAEGRGTPVNSIDEAANLYSKEMEDEYGRPPVPEDFGLTAREVFWGHCSNLQAWEEYDYDPRLLHSNLSIPLLRKLTEKGDLKARKIYKEEIARRFLETTDERREIMEMNGYTDEFTDEEYFQLALIEKHNNIIWKMSKQCGKKPQDILDFSSVVNRKIIRLSFYEKVPEALRELKDSLVFLELSGEVPEVPEWIGELKHLKKLKISSKFVQNIPESIGDLSELEQLRIEYCQITELPESIGNLSSLKELIINQTKLTALPDSIGNLKYLERLSIEKCQLILLPESIGMLRAMKSLSIYSTHLNELPTSLGKLTELRGLSIFQNRFEDFPHIIKFLKNLEYLRIEKNKYETLPIWLSELPQLKSLSIDKHIANKNPKIIELLKFRNIELYQE